MSPPSDAACPPCTQELRDGDWSAKRATAIREAGADGGDSPQAACTAPGEGTAGASDTIVVSLAEGAADDDGDEADGADEFAADDRLEGTAVYLAPELVAGGGRPSVASDGWAFGCTLYQALCGRPPLWAETQSETMRRIVRFEGIEQAEYPAAVPPLARDLISALLQPDPEKRLARAAGTVSGDGTGTGTGTPTGTGAGTGTGGDAGASDGWPAPVTDGLAAVRAHAFFEGLDGEALYTQAPPPLAGGAAPPQPNAAWTRRQNSIMWSPLPQRYAFGEDGSEALEPLAEGAEARASFTRKLLNLEDAARAAAALREPGPQA